MVVEILANETGEALELIKLELSDLRQLSLQNREALDITLAAQGGTLQGSNWEGVLCVCP